ncbi:MAG: AraC family transcriptional regulator [Pseudomonadales bacterium]|nr:AraC family transcriptional regulator [Pseudomonadales bacterium]
MKGKIGDNKTAIINCEAIKKISVGSDDIVSKVRIELEKNSRARLTIVEVASELCMCHRSLQRKLTKSGISFRELKTEEQIKKAKYFLEQTPFTIENISRELGYSHPSNFIKYFKSVTGHPPRQYRQLKTSKRQS